MKFFNKQSLAMIVSCLCVLILTQQVHTKDKSDFPPLTGETCTEGPDDTQMDHFELLENIFKRGLLRFLAVMTCTKLPDDIEEIEEELFGKDLFNDKSQDLFRSKNQENLGARIRKMFEKKRPMEILPLQ